VIADDQLLAAHLVRDFMWCADSPMHGHPQHQMIGPGRIVSILTGTPQAQVPSRVQICVLIW
jgi:hypothetical protein